MNFSSHRTISSKVVLTKVTLVSLLILGSVWLSSCAIKMITYNSAPTVKISDKIYSFPLSEDTEIKVNFIQLSDKRTKIILDGYEQHVKREIAFREICYRDGSFKTVHMNYEDDKNVPIGDTIYVYLPATYADNLPETLADNYHFSFRDNNNMPPELLLPRIIISWDWELREYGGTKLKQYINGTTFKIYKSDEYLYKKDDKFYNRRNGQNHDGDPECRTVDALSNLIGKSKEQFVQTCLNDNLRRKKVAEIAHRYFKQEPQYFKETADRKKIDNYSYRIDGNYGDFSIVQGNPRNEFILTLNNNNLFLTKAAAQNSISTKYAQFYDSIAMRMETIRLIDNTGGAQLVPFTYYDTSPTYAKIEQSKSKTQMPSSQAHSGNSANSGWEYEPAPSKKPRSSSKSSSGWEYVTSEEYRKEVNRGPGNPGNLGVLSHARDIAGVVGDGLDSFDFILFFKLIKHGDYYRALADIEEAIVPNSDDRLVAMGAINGYVIASIKSNDSRSTLLSRYARASRQVRLCEIRYSRWNETKHYSDIIWGERPVSDVCK